jgi:eukaryotic-like serine/threonine-protein kinase
LVGKTVSHYRILDKLGEGGMGIVYKAEDTRLDRVVALKLLAPHLLRHTDSRTRFVREAKAAAALEHPNICMVFEIDEADGQTFLAMSFVDGENLKEKIEHRPLKLEGALDIAIQIAEGLQAAHWKSVVHRDVKPGNILIDTEGQVKIVDFGLAQLGKLTQITESGTTLGTPAYMSPEQVEGREVDHRADIWSLGVVFYEMLTGRLPFEGDTQQAISHKILYEEPEPPTALRGRLPLELDRIVEKALAKDRAERYQHADDLIVDLRRLKRQSESGIATQTVQAIPAPPPPIWRRWAIPGAVALVALAAGLGWFLLPDGTAPTPEAPLRVIPLTSYPGLEEHPSLSPDGTQVAFRWNGTDQDNWDIYAKIIGPQESQQRLTTDPAEDYGPAWSPDGTAIAFLRDLGETKAGVFVIPARGGAERKVAEIYDRLLRWRLSWGMLPRVAWTPDSQRLIVGGEAPDPKSPGFFLVSLATSELRRVSDGGGFFPVVSPDGRKLAFGRDYCWWVMPLADNYEPTAEAVRISEKNVPSGIFWGPDSQELFFARDDRLWRVDASGGGEPQMVQSVTGQINNPVVSHQRRRLVYSARQGLSNLWRLDLLRSGQPQGQPVRLESSSMAYDASPRCSSDGKRIAFESSRGGHSQIYVCDSNGRNLVQLTSSRGAFSPAWSPDGKRVAFVTAPAQTRGLHIMNDDGSGMRRLTETFAVNPSWSLDGSWIYYSVGTQRESEVWKVPAEGGTPIQLTRRAEAANGATPQEALDGQHVYFVKGDGLWRISVDGGEESQVLDSVYLRNYAVCRDGIYFIPIPKPGDPWSIQFWSYATDTTKSIATLDHRPAQGMSAPIDGRYVVLTLREGTSDLKLVEDFKFYR